MADQLSLLKDADRSLFPSSFTIRALRDSRYHNTAYAIAELIDNSVEAESRQIELLCMERSQLVKANMSRRISELAVLDNGKGMDGRILLEALKFGGGTRHNALRGIGKYGMGLPTASMSQCKRVDVWTWQDGINSAWHSSIDADIIEGGDSNVPFPDQETPIPAVWRAAGSAEVFESQSGTLVVWSKLDKIQWKTGRAIIENVAQDVGRIHRHFINDQWIHIRAASFFHNQPNYPEHELYVRANDPLYLMTPSSVPEEPWDSVPMFEQWSDTVRTYTYVVDGKEETIEVKYSIVKPEALKTELATQNPGATPRGRHARHNIGVSVVREGREIVLEDAFLREGGSAENPQNRWWGCEVHFQRSCDELFGVDHNKQMAANFTQAAKVLARDDRNTEAILQEINEEDNLIYTIVGDIRLQTRSMMRQIEQMFNQKRKQSTSISKTPEKKATQAASQADKEAVASKQELPTKTDKDRETIPSEERESELTKQFMESGQSSQDAQELARSLVQSGLAYQFNAQQLDGFRFFNVRSNQGILHINLNTDHPIYNWLNSIEGRLDENIDEDDPAFEAIVAIRLLLLSWGRMEDQTESLDERRYIQEISNHWGRQVDKVVRQLRDRDG